MSRVTSLGAPYERVALGEGSILARLPRVCNRGMMLCEEPEQQTVYLETRLGMIHLWTQRLCLFLTAEYTLQTLVLGCMNVATIVHMALGIVGALLCVARASSSRLPYLNSERIAMAIFPVLVTSKPFMDPWLVGNDSLPLWNRVAVFDYSLFDTQTIGMIVLFYMLVPVRVRYSWVIAAVAPCAQICSSFILCHRDPKVSLPSRLLIGVHLMIVCCVLLLYCAQHEMQFREQPAEAQKKENCPEPGQVHSDAQELQNIFPCSVPVLPGFVPNNSPEKSSELGAYSEAVKISTLEKELAAFRLELDISRYVGGVIAATAYSLVLPEIGEVMESSIIPQWQKSKVASQPADSSRVHNERRSDSIDAIREMSAAAQGKTESITLDIKHHSPSARIMPRLSSNTPEPGEDESGHVLDQTTGVRISPSTLGASANEYSQDSSYTFWMQEAEMSRGATSKYGDNFTWLADKVEECHDQDDMYDAAENLLQPMTPKHEDDDGDDKFPPVVWFGNEKRGSGSIHGCEDQCVEVAPWQLQPADNSYLNTGDLRCAADKSVSSFIEEINNVFGQDHELFSSNSWMQEDSRGGDNCNHNQEEYHGFGHTFDCNFNHNSANKHTDHFNDTCNSPDKRSLCKTSESNNIHEDHKTNGKSDTRGDNNKSNENNKYRHNDKNGESTENKTSSKNNSPNKQEESNNRNNNSPSKKNSSKKSRSASRQAESSNVADILGVHSAVEPSSHGAGIVTGSRAAQRVSQRCLVEHAGSIKEDSNIHGSKAHEIQRAEAPAHNEVLNRHFDQSAADQPACFQRDPRGAGMSVPSAGESLSYQVPRRTNDQVNYNNSYVQCSRSLHEKAAAKKVTPLNLVENQKGPCPVSQTSISSCSAETSTAARQEQWQSYSSKGWKHPSTKNGTHSHSQPSRSSLFDAHSRSIPTPVDENVKSSSSVVEAALLESEYAIDESDLPQALNHSGGAVAWREVLSNGML